MTSINTSYPPHGGFTLDDKNKSKTSKRAVKSWKDKMLVDLTLVHTNIILLYIPKSR